ncbi:MAG TPA: hydantoinase/oxoprolinase family protein [Geminicoccaceae bacterium]|nr:hydantoinase/oxoprolinase family protein [Geminicoccaceae bacterium]
MIRIGVDVGGTFTDLMAVDDQGAISVVKTPTTVANQADGVLAAITASGYDLASVATLVHGTTTTTNAFLERKVARVGLITTRGFRDVLELGRRTRPNPYGMTGTFEPLIERPYRLEVAERTSAEGEVLVPLDPAEVGERARALMAAGCEAVVIHFLHSYANPAHELAAEAAVRAVWPNRYVTVGHKILSEYREYERGCTASVNAAVQPVLDRYVARLARRLRDGGYAHELLIVQGNGGTLPAGMVVEDAVKTVMSGPAAGVIAAAWTARHAGIADVITYDMGGTSSDVALILGGVPSVSAELELDYAMPVHVPMVDVNTLGAGGGSIARLDEAGLLRVGPESAGADPGPICYGRGGVEPTITDANLLLGRLPADRLLSVDHPVSMADIEAAILARIGQPLGLSAVDAAAAILRIANDRMAGAIRMASVARGHDPRDFALLAFGGAGPLHATALARELGIPRVLVPPRPGVTNALGCLVADARHDFVRTLNRPLAGLDMGELRAVALEQRAEGRAALARETTPIEGETLLVAADMQFRGQTHLIRVALPEAELLDGSLQLEALQERFAEAYFQRFAVRLPEIGAMLVNLVTTLIGHRPALAPEALVAGDARATGLAGARLGERPVWFAGAFRPTPVYDRQKLPLSTTFEGPAIVQQLDATTVIEPGDTVEVDRLGNLLITVGA